MDRLQKFLLAYFGQKFNVYVPAFEKIDPQLPIIISQCEIHFAAETAKFQRTGEAGDLVRTELPLNESPGTWQNLLDEFFSLSPETKLLLQRFQQEVAKNHAKLKYEVLVTGWGGKEPGGTVVVSTSLDRIEFAWSESSIWFPSGQDWAIHCYKNKAEWALGRRAEIKAAILANGEFKGIKDSGRFLNFHSWIHYRP